MLLAVGIGIFFYMKAHRFDGLVPGITTKKIKLIELGMNEAEVRKILGPPLAISNLASSFERRTGMLGNFAGLTYVYAKDLKSLWYPKLWVSFDNGKIDAVYAKSYVFDDVGVYGRSLNYCEPEDPKRATIGCS